MKVHYLEIVSPDVDAICAAYEAAHNVQFGEADELLGGARTCRLADGGIVGVREPLRETEEPVVRPYWLVEDIDKAISLATGLLARHKGIIHHLQFTSMVQSTMASGSFDRESPARYMDHQPLRGLRFPKRAALPAGCAGVGIRWN